MKIRIHEALPYILLLLSLSCARLTGGGASSPATSDGVLPVGDSTQTIQVGDLRRTFYLHVPGSYDGTEPVPVVLAFHGGFGTGRGMAKLTGFSELSERKGFIVVYPDGLRRQWNDGRRLAASERQKVDDVAFISKLIDHLAQTLTIDRGRVYTTGISNGGSFSHLLACELSDKVTAIAPVAGTIAENVVDLCHPARPVPVMAFHGTEDTLVPFDGSKVKRTARGPVLSVPATAAFWAGINGCPDPLQVSDEPDLDPTDGTTVQRQAYEACEDGSEVMSYVIEGDGHTWPGGLQYLPVQIIGRTSRDISATEMIWDFFVKHRKP